MARPRRRFDPYGIPQVRFHAGARDNDVKMMADMYGWMEQILRACDAEILPYKKFVEPMGDAITLRFGDQVRTAVRAHTYDALGPGQIGLVVDSYGLVSVALARRSAADELRLQAPTEISLEPAAG